MKVTALDDSLRLITTNTGIGKGMIALEKPWPQAFQWLRFVIDCYLLLCNTF